jgi:uncharacterized protein YkwD
VTPRAVSVAVLCALGAVALARDPLPPLPATTGLEAAERVILEQTNLERRRAGLPPLVIDARLSAAARLHAREMAQKGYFAHESPTPGLTTPSDRIHAAGSIDWSAGENIAFNEDPARNAGASLMRQWMTSRPHRESILKRAYTHVGIGVYRDAQGRNYGVQDFVERNFDVGLDLTAGLRRVEELALSGTVPANFEVALFAGEDFVGGLPLRAGVFDARVPFVANTEFRIGTRPVGSSGVFTIGATLRTPTAFQNGALRIGNAFGSRFSRLNANLIVSNINAHTLNLTFKRTSAPVRVFTTRQGEGERGVPVVDNRRATFSCPVSSERVAVRLAYAQGARYTFTHRFVLDCSNGQVIAGAEQ